MAFFCKSFAVELLICAIPSFRFGGRVVTEWQSEHIRWTKFQSSSLCSHLAVCPVLILFLCEVFCLYSRLATKNYCKFTTYLCLFQASLEMSRFLAKCTIFCFSSFNQKVNALECKIFPFIFCSFCYPASSHILQLSYQNLPILPSLFVASSVSQNPAHKYQVQRSYQKNCQRDTNRL